MLLSNGGLNWKAASNIDTLRSEIDALQDRPSAAGLRAFFSVVMNLSVPVST